MPHYLSIKHYNVPWRPYLNKKQKTRFDSYIFLPSYFSKNCAPSVLCCDFRICTFTRLEDDVYTSISLDTPPQILLFVPELASEMYPYIEHSIPSISTKLINENLTCCPWEISITQGWVIEPQPVSSVTWLERYPPLPGTVLDPLLWQFEAGLNTEWSKKGQNK